MITVQNELIILHLDMDSFYASVEIRDDPALLGLPVIIGADPKGGFGRGVVSTCSYKAREYGVHSAMPISQAYKLCPHARFIPPSMKKYAAVSKNIMELLISVTGEIEQVSIDEAFLDLSFCETYEAAAEKGRFIKDLIKEQENLTCSIGIAPSRTYAKIASEQHKPDGLVVVPPTDLISFLHPLSVGKIPGIGKKSVEMLTTIGVSTIGDLADVDIQILQDIFGLHAVRIQHIALGLDREELHKTGQRRSIGRDYTFPVDTADAAEIKDEIERMIQSVCDELASRNTYARSLSIRVRYQGFITRTKTVSREHPTRDIRIITKALFTLFDEIWTGDAVRLIGIRCSGLTISDTSQKSLNDFI